MHCFICISWAIKDFVIIMIIIFIRESQTYINRINEFIDKGIEKQKLEYLNIEYYRTSYRKK